MILITGIQGSVFLVTKNRLNLTYLQSTKQFRVIVFVVGGKMFLKRPENGRFRVV